MPIEESNKTEEDILAAVLKRATPTTVPEPPPKAEPVSEITSKQPVWTLPGFHAKARVFTIFGELPIEALRRRDKVRTVTGAYVEVKWVDKVQLDVDFLERHPEAQPILIRTSALGKARPQTNVMVSPGQRMRVHGLVGEEGEKPAGELAGKRNILRMPHSGFTYYQFHCGTAATVSVEGLWFNVAP